MLDGKNLNIKVKINKIAVFVCSGMEREMFLKYATFIARFTSLALFAY